MKMIKRVGVSIIMICLVLVNLVGCSQEKSKKVVGDNTIVIKEKYLISYVDDKAGLIDMDKKQIIENEYDQLRYCKGMDMFYALKGNGWGLIDIKENIIIPFKYTFIYEDNEKGKVYASDLENTYIYNKKGKIERTLPYGFAVGSKKGTYIVSKNVRFDYDKEEFVEEKLGLINEEGEEILPLEYDDLSYSYQTYQDENDGKAFSIFAKKDGKAGVYNLQGEILIPLEYDANINPYEGEELEYRYDGYGINYNAYTNSYRVIKDGKQGVIDANGKTLIETKYDMISANAQGYLAQIKEEEDSYSGENEYFYYDTKGKQFLTIKSWNAALFAKNGYAVAFNDEGAYVMDKKGKEVSLPVLKKSENIDIYGFDNNGNLVVNDYDGEKQKSYLINDEGEYVIKPIKAKKDEMLRIQPLDSDYEDFNSYYYFSAKTSYASSDDYVVTVTSISKNGNEETYDNDHSLFYNKKGEKLGEFEGSIIGGLDDNFYHITKQTEDEDQPYLEGLVNRKGKLVVKMEYDGIVGYDDYFVAYKGDKKYLLDKEDGSIKLEY